MDLAAIPGSKVVSLRAAVANHVVDGMHIRIGGFGTRTPHCVVYEILRQGQRDLHFSAAGPVESLDMLVGAGRVTVAETSWSGLEVMGLAPNIRRAAERADPHPVTFRDYTHLAMASRYWAGAMGLPFVPIKSMLGSDLLKESGAVQMDCPFTGERLALLPALTPDLATLHVQRADPFGNAQVWGPRSDDDVGSLAARKILVTCEELVAPEVIENDPDRTIVAAHQVAAVVHAPFGAHPWNVMGYYGIDLPFRRLYADAAQTPDGFQRFLEEWVYEVPDHAAYLEKLGEPRLARLRPPATRLTSPVNYY
jgi:glutaconate CoA-transferase, subunit A